MIETMQPKCRPAQLSHRELVGQIAANPRDYAVAREFILRYDPLIRRTVACALRGKTGKAAKAVPQPAINEAVNKVYSLLFQDDCKALWSFQCRYDNSIFSYLRAICQNAVRNHLRDEARRPRFCAWPALGPPESGSVPPRADRGKFRATTVAGMSVFECRALEEMLRAKFFRAFRAQDGPRNYLIFKLHFLYGYHCHEIARIQALGLGESGVGNAAARIRKWLRREFAQRGRAL